MLDGAVAILDAVSGVEPQTETVWRQADKYRVPRIVYVNKMDRIGADFYRCLDMLRTGWARIPVAIQLPIGARGPASAGVIDLIDEVALRVGRGRRDARQGVQEGRDPGRHARTRCKEYREKMIEGLAEVDEHLMEKYLDGETITPDGAEGGGPQGHHRHEARSR